MMRFLELFWTAVDFVRAHGLAFYVGFCAATPFVAFIAACGIRIARRKNLRRYCRARGFIRKNGVVNADNGACFAKKFTRGMKKSAKKAWKDFFVTRQTYGASELCARTREEIYRNVGKTRVYGRAALAAILFLQAVLLCYRLSWLSVYLLTGICAVVALIGKFVDFGAEKAADAIDAVFGAKLDTLLASSVKTGADAAAARVDLEKLDMKLPDGRKASLGNLADCIDSFVDTCPEPAMLRVIAQSLPAEVGISASEEDKARYLRALSRMKKY